MGVGIGGGFHLPPVYGQLVTRMMGNGKDLRYGSDGKHQSYWDVAAGHLLCIVGGLRSRTARKELCTRRCVLCSLAIWQIYLFKKDDARTLGNQGAYEAEL